MLLYSCRSTYFARALDSLLAVVTSLLDLPSTASKGSHLFIHFSPHSIDNIHEYHYHHRSEKWLCVRILNCSRVCFHKSKMLERRYAHYNM